MTEHTDQACGSSAAKKISLNKCLASYIQEEFIVLI